MDPRAHCSSHRNGVHTSFPGEKFPGYNSLMAAGLLSGLLDSSPCVCECSVWLEGQANRRGGVRVSLPARRGEHYFTTNRICAPRGMLQL